MHHVGLCLTTFVKLRNLAEEIGLESLVNGTFSHGVPYMSSHKPASRLTFKNICNTTDSCLDGLSQQGLHENSRFQRSKHSRFAPLRAAALAAKKIQSSQEDKSQENSRWPSLGSFWLAAEDVWLFYHQVRFCFGRMTGLKDRCHRSAMLGGPVASMS